MPPKKSFVFDLGQGWKIFSIEVEIRLRRVLSPALVGMMVVEPNDTI